MLPLPLRKSPLNNAQVPQRKSSAALFSIVGRAALPPPTRFDTHQANQKHHPSPHMSSRSEGMTPANSGNTKQLLQILLILPVISVATIELAQFPTVFTTNVLLGELLQKLAKPVDL